MWPFAAALAPDQIAELAAQYRQAKPFPHLILDDFFTEEALDTVAMTFGRPLGWHRYEHNKRGLMDVADQPVVAALMDNPVLGLLEYLTGVPILLSDPTMRGAGLHAIPAGGRLGIHVDFNRHPDRPLRRAVNTLLYLNKDWDPDWHGQLTLTDRVGCEVTLEPRWNRWVIFGYGEDTWHGHPEPLACPSERTRRSLALYYYTPMTPAEDADLTFHTTIYADRLPTP